MKKKILNQIRARRKKRTRVKIFGTSAKPRLSVFRSHRQSYVQLIDDKEGKTLLSASTKSLKTKDKKVSAANLLGQLIAKKALEQGITRVVFDRGDKKYHGRVRAIAEGAREGGLKI